MAQLVWKNIKVIMTNKNLNYKPSFVAFIYFYVFQIYNLWFYTLKYAFLGLVYKYYILSLVIVNKGLQPAQLL